MDEKINDATETGPPPGLQSDLPPDLQAVEQIRSLLAPFGPMARQAILEYVRATSAAPNPYANVVGAAGQLGVNRNFVNCLVK